MCSFLLPSLHPSKLIIHRRAIDVLLSENNYFVLENDPSIRKRWKYQKSIGKIISLVSAIRNEHYDFAVDMMDNPSVTSTILCLVFGARWNVGIAKDNTYVYDIRVPMLSRRDSHIVDRIAQLLLPFHIDPGREELKIRYTTSAESDDDAERFLQTLSLNGHPLPGINISAGGSARFWGVENYRALLSYMSDQYPALHFILLYQPSDEEKAKAIVQDYQNITLSPLTRTFDQFAALIKRLSFLISPDTSAIHLASAFQIPSVVLYVQSDKALRIWEPYGSDFEVVVTDVDDLSTIPVEEVQRACTVLMNRSLMLTAAARTSGVKSAL